MHDADRVFDDFWCQSSRLMSCFSDMALDLPPRAPLANNNFQAKYVTDYLERYLDNHVYNGKSLRQRVRLNAGVEAVTKDASAWTVRISQSFEHFTCKRLVVATGLSSTPVVPSILRAHADLMPVIHHKDFGKHADTLLRPDSTHQRMTVVGAGKSAADLVYAALKAGKAVSWLIRQSGGRGPGIFLEPKAPTGYEHPSEALTTLAGSELSPSAFHPPSTHAWEQHHTEEGRAALRARYAALDDRCKRYADYTGRKNARVSFASLEPRHS